MTDLFSFFDITGWLVDALSFLASPWLFLVILVAGAAFIAVVALFPFLGPYAPVAAVVMMLYGALAGWEHTALAAREGQKAVIAQVKANNQAIEAELKEQRDHAQAALNEEQATRDQIGRDLTVARARIAAQAKQPGQDGPMAPVLRDTVRRP